MVTKDNGGTAFPIVGTHQEVLEIGMTLRDYAAMKAMPQFIHEVFAGNLDDHGYDSVARHAYRMADAMLKAREA